MSNENDAYGNTKAAWQSSIPVNRDKDNEKLSQDRSLSKELDENATHQSPIITINDSQVFIDQPRRSKSSDTAARLSTEGRQA